MYEMCKHVNKSYKCGIMHQHYRCRASSTILHTIPHFIYIPTIRISLVLTVTKRCLVKSVGIRKQHPKVYPELYPGRVLTVLPLPIIITKLSIDPVCLINAFCI